MEILKRFSKNSTKPFEAYLLSDEEFIELQKQYPRKLQNELKREWGYSSLLRKLAENDIEYEAHILSAHRVPEKLEEVLENLESTGTEVIIAGAGLAAHLPGVIASKSILPVIGSIS